MSGQNESNGKLQQQVNDTNMFLPSALEYILLFKTFAAGAKLPTTVLLY